MPIQDNLHGALLISAIDFILSFVIIGGIGVILALFPLLNKFGPQAAKASQPVPTLLKETGVTAASPATQAATAGGIHPGLTDQQLVVLLTAAACEAQDGAVRVVRFRPVIAKGGNWAAQGRHELQSHRLK